MTTTTTGAPEWKTGTLIYGDQPGKIIYWKENPYGGAIFTWTEEEPNPEHSWDSRFEMISYVEQRGGDVHYTHELDPSGVESALDELTRRTAPATGNLRSLYGLLNGAKS